VVHRDIKPSNILFDSGGRAKVGDFGLAKPARADGVATLTGSAELLGTPTYSSPEQAKGVPLDFRSDIYSLGIVCWEMLVGERPFTGPTPFSIVDKHIHEPLPSVRSRRPELPGEVDEMLQWMASKQPGQRPGSYRDLLDPINRFAHADPGQTARIPVARGTSHRRKLALLGGLGAAALAVIAITGVMVWSSGGRTTAGRSEGIARARSTGTTGVAAAMGRVVIDASPWAEVVEIREGNGTEVPLASRTFTPAVLDLPPGRYAVTLRHPLAPKPELLAVEVAAGKTGRYRASVRLLTADEFLTRLGL
jgi:hypothetical protein